jgi:hypothetical protein
MGDNTCCWALPMFGHSNSRTTPLLVGFGDAFNRTAIADGATVDRRLSPSRQDADTISNRV